MTQQNDNKANAPSTRTPEIVPDRNTIRHFVWATIVIIACFSQPLYQLVTFALKNDLYSHILLVPIVTLYLVWIKRTTLPNPEGPDRVTAGIFFALGSIFLFVFWNLNRSGSIFAEDDYLASRTLSFLFFIVGITAYIFGRAVLRSVTFPLVFLIFMVPFPIVLKNDLETLLQHGSAEVAHVLFRLAGTTVFYHDLLFRLPGINLEVAPECSGIRSSLALFITSLIAGHFFLRTPWKIIILTLAVIPLALFRNGFRIFTIGELCVHVGPDMIDSRIHHQGGPIFFILSLIPFFFLLRLFFRSEVRPDTRQFHRR